MSKNALVVVPKAESPATAEKTPKIRFIHLRHYEVESPEVRSTLLALGNSRTRTEPRLPTVFKPTSRGGATIAFEEVEGGIVWEATECSLQQNFCRKIGRNVTTGRIRISGYSEFTPGETAEEFVDNVFKDWFNRCNVTGKF